MNLKRKDERNKQYSDNRFVWYSVSPILAVVLMSASLTGCLKPSMMPLVLDNRLTAPCERPTLQGETNRDSWELNLQQAYALGECDGRMTAIRGLTRPSNPVGIEIRGKQQ